ncbi:MAG: DUF4091 domain-containing protein [Solobacterium sp.]|nr:DUF4091 domain-containing protein [Solobacterium sp.]
MKKRRLVLFCLILLLGLIHPIYAEEDFDAYFSDAQSLDIQNEGTSTLKRMWRNETIYLKVAIPIVQDTTIKLSATSLLNKQTKKEIEQVTYGHLETTSASLGVGEQASYPHIEVPDILSRETSFSAKANTIAYAWIQIHTSLNQASGTYEGSFLLETDQITKELKIQIEVLDITVPSENELSIDLWQYPHSSYRYYNHIQEPFSKEHKEVLKEELRMYKALGGNTITVSMIEEPWGHQTYDDTPSLIKWMRKEDGSVYFDYQWFDEWVSLCEEIGIDGRIEAFSILPFDPTIDYTTESGEKIRYYVEVGSEEWKSIWGYFLEMFLYHLEEKGWMDRTYIFIDERDNEQVKQAIALIQSIAVNNKQFKIASAINRIPEELDLFDHINYVAISVEAVGSHEEELEGFLEHRKGLGLETALYNCSTNYPNAFAISEPIESIWTMAYAYQMGFEGYLRWAYNAYVENPNETLDFHNFEAGDTLLIYPDAKEAIEPMPRKSMRLAMIEVGMQKVRQIKKLQELGYSTQTDVTLKTIQKPKGAYNAYGAVVAQSEEEKEKVSNFVKSLEQALEQDTTHYLQVKPRKINACP